MSNELCKLTTADLTTHGGFRWEPGVWAETSGKGELCTWGWIHLYTHPLLAVALNPIHAAFPDDALLWSVEVDGARKEDHGLKLGVSRLRLLERIEKPVIPTAALVRWAIELSLLVYDGSKYRRWAEGWSAGSAAWATEAAREAAMAVGEAAAEAAATPLDLLGILQRAIEAERGMWE